MWNTVLAWITESLACDDSLVNVMTRLAPAALLMLIALAAFDDLAAAPGKNDAAPVPQSQIRFYGAVVVPAGSHTVADVHSVASLSPGRIVRLGSAAPGSDDPPRTVTVLPPRKPSMRVVLITYD
jgi:hypothetical protein